MKGHLVLRGSTWYVVIDLARDLTGKRQQKWISVKGTKQDAQKELARIQLELLQHAYTAPANMTVAEYFKEWLTTEAAARVSPKTLESYTEYLLLHMAPILGRHKLANLTPAHIHAYYLHAQKAGRRSGGGLSARTVLHHHRVLKQALQHAVSMEYLGKNPAAAVKAPKPEDVEQEVLAPPAILKVLEEARGSRLFLPIMLAVTCGMRRGEILGLRWKDLQLETGRLSVKQSLSQTRTGMAFKAPKSKQSRRSITLPALAMQALGDHKLQQEQERTQCGPAYQDHDLVVCEPDGRPRSPRAMSAAFATFIDGCGFKGVRFHDLRHSHATLLLGQGVHPKIVSERLGHSTTNLTLNLYSHVLPTMQDEAAANVDRVLKPSD